MQLANAKAAETQRQEGGLSIPAKGSVSSWPSLLEIAKALGVVVDSSDPYELLGYLYWLPGYQSPSVDDVLKRTRALQTWFHPDQHQGMATHDDMAKISELSGRLNAARVTMISDIERRRFSFVRGRK